MALFEPGLGTLEALRREFARRMPQHLRAVTRGAKTGLFDGKVGDGGNSLVALAGRIVELRTTLHVTEAAIDRVAENYLMGYLQIAHITPAEATSLSQVQLAESLLA
jgi:hypothetical protein